MKSVILVSYPQGMAKESDFEIRESEKPTLSDEGSFLVKLSHISVDPYMRGRMTPSKDSYTPPFELNKPISGFTAGEVVESKSAKYPVGTLISCISDHSEYVVLNEKSPLTAKLDLDKSQVSHSLGVLGMPGNTAYFGFFDICQPKEGDVVVVSGGSGAVGSYVIQLAKTRGCKVIGIAGSDEKTKVIREELGGDFAINYKTENVLEKLKEYAPTGVDIYFDNVGGEITDAVFNVLKVNARVSSCGSISVYNDLEKDIGPRQWWRIITKGIKVQGFVVSREFGARWAEGVTEMTKLLKEGKIVAKESVVEGIENVPKAFISLFTGGNVGKQIIQL